MSKINGTDIIEHLRALSTGEIKPRDNTSGICEELESKFLSSEMTTKVVSALLKWNKREMSLYDKSELYPIPGGVTAYNTYQENNLNMWDPNDSYGQTRLEATRWLAENFNASYWEKDLLI